MSLANLYHQFRVIVLLMITIVFVLLILLHKTAAKLQMLHGVTASWLTDVCSLALVLTVEPCYFNLRLTVDQNPDPCI